MRTVSDLFDVQVARSAPFDDHDPGGIPFISNGYRDNGVLGYVAPLPADRVFPTTAICVSAFCEATVQEGPFIARGNGGSGLTILVPKAPMSRPELWTLAGFLGECHGWKFTFGRMATKGRLRLLHIPDAVPSAVVPGMSGMLPRLGDAARLTASAPLHFKRVPVTELFRVVSGDYHSTEELDEGVTPLVSCGERDNGIIGFYSPPKETVYRDRLTVAYNGDYPLMAKFHPYDFATKDDVALLHPREPLRLTTLLFVQMLFNRETWRHSYGRKLYRARLEKFELPVPFDGEGRVDEDGIASRIHSHPLWGDVGKSLENGLSAIRRGTFDLLQDTVR